MMLTRERPRLYLNRFAEQYRYYADYLGHIGYRLPRAMRRRMGASQGPPVNSSMCWIHEDTDWHSRVFLLDYWGENYKMPGPRIRMTLYDRDGQCRLDRDVTVPVDGALCIESAALVDEAGLTRPFDGSLLFRLADERLVADRHIKAVLDCYGPGWVTSVHEQGRCQTITCPTVYTTMHAIESDAEATWLVLQNCWHDPAHAVDVRPRIEIINAAGAHRRVRLAAIPPLATVRVRLRDVVPDLLSFLGGRSGGIRVHTNVLMSRTVYYVEDLATSRISMSHGTADKRAPRHALSAAERTFVDSGTVWTAPVIETGDVRTRVVLFNSYGFGEPYALRLRLFRADGVEVVDRVLDPVLAPDETRVLMMEDCLAAAGVGRPFTGHVHISFATTPSRRDYPLEIDALAEYLTAGGFGGVQIGSEAFNLHHHPAYEPNRFPHLPTTPRTKLFSRVVDDDRYEMSIALMNSGARMDYATVAKPVVQLFRASGGAKLETQLAIPAFGTVVATLDALFPEHRTFLAPNGGVGRLRVRDTACRLFGLHFLRDRSSGCLGVDHLWGG